MSSAANANEAFVTLATNGKYAISALVLVHSLKNVGTTRKVLIMVTPQVDKNIRALLESAFDEVIDVDVMDSKDSAHLSMIKRPELGVTFTKLHCWSLVQYEKMVFLDSDIVALQNVDDLFLREELSAAPDCGWPDCFNSGVFVFKPSLETYQALLFAAETEGSFDGGDQGLLNHFFNSWSTGDNSRRLPFIYNMVASAAYFYLPAYRAYGEKAKLVHYLGASKPWMYNYNMETGDITAPCGVETNPQSMELVKKWWDIYTNYVYPVVQNCEGVEHLNIGNGTCEFTSSGSHSESEGSYPDGYIGSKDHQRDWETGNIQYTGIDKYENIEKHIKGQIEGATTIQKTGDSTTKVNEQRTKGDSMPARKSSKEGKAGLDEHAQKAAVGKKYKLKSK